MQRFQRLSLQKELLVAFFARLQIDMFYPKEAVSGRVDTVVDELKAFPTWV